MARFAPLLLAALVACSPATRATGRCPTLPALAVDFTIASVGLAAGVYAFNERAPAATIALVSGSMLVALAANLSECR